MTLLLSTCCSYYLSGNTCLQCGKPSEGVETACKEDQQNKNKSMTEEEKKLFELTADVWNAFLKLPIQHISDRPEFMVHIHAIQNIILAREGFRNLKQREQQEKAIGNYFFQQKMERVEELNQKL